VSSSVAGIAMVEIAGYTDLEPIGSGGFAVVYRARQLSVGRDVAIKLLTDPMPDDDLVRRFHRESQAVGALSWHPHIAAVVDAGSTAHGQAFIVFELLSGGSLEEQLVDGPMAWPDAVSAMIQIADAVEAAHRADVLHRDIKPANILLDRLGVAKLGDFGIASMQDGNKTETGMLATTIAHAAPELFNGDPASAATDVYALGSTLHTLLAGDPPFLGSSGEQIAPTITRILHEPPPRLDKSIAPPELTTVIAHALAKQPEYRPRTAGAFGHALQNVQDELGQPVTRMPVAGTAPATPSHPAASPLPASPQHSPTQNVPFPLTGDTGYATPSPTRKPFGRTITLLSTLVVLGAVALGGLLLWQQSQSPATIRTQGGAVIVRYDALAETEMPKPFDADSALDQDETTYWGIEPSDEGFLVAGTSYLIELSEEQLVSRVGISNGQSTQFGRVSGIDWATGFDAESQAAKVSQVLDDDAGPQSIAFDVSTDQIVLVITGTHNDATDAGIAEILIEVEEGPTS